MYLTVPIRLFRADCWQVNAGILSSEISGAEPDRFQVADCGRAFGAVTTLIPVLGQNHAAVVSWFCGPLFSLISLLLIPIPQAAIDRALLKSSGVHDREVHKKLMPDLLHPNAKGHELLSACFQSALENFEVPHTRVQS